MKIVVLDGFSANPGDLSWEELKKLGSLTVYDRTEPDETVVTSNYMAAGAGPVKDVTHYYYSGDFDENLGREFYSVYFMTRKYNVGAVDYYQEFLFDDEGSLIFYFEKSGTNETRYYWGPDGLVKEDVKGERLMDEVFAMRLSYELKNAYSLLMNREF